MTLSFSFLTMWPISDWFIQYPWHGLHSELTANMSPTPYIEDFKHFFMLDFHRIFQELWKSEALNLAFSISAAKSSANIRGTFDKTTTCAGTLLDQLFLDERQDSLDVDIGSRRTSLSFCLPLARLPHLYSRQRRDARGVTIEESTWSKPEKNISFPLLLKYQ